MKKNKRGFTLIEVAIFLAVTGALFVGVMVGVQNSIYQQRANDAVQNFVEFLRNVYAGVANVQDTGGGRSERAVYGKLITFGESHNLAGEQLPEDDNNAIFVYTVVGDIDDTKSGGTLSLLNDLNASVVKRAVKEGVQTVELAGIAERYTPRWAAQIEPSCGNKSVEDCEYEPLKGMILIVKHPNSGTVYTYYSAKLAEINDTVSKARAAGLDVDPLDISGGGNYLTSGDFVMGQIDFCINTTGEQKVANRADVRILQGAKNASGIEIIPSDNEGYKCGK